jgi:uncharacterized protein YjbI with pentapeptide repeats
MFGRIGGPKFSRVALAGLLLSLSTHVLWPTSTLGADRGCTLRGDDTRRITIPATEVIRCIAAGKAVDLDRVQVVGPLDLEKIPITKIAGKNGPGLPGMPEPRAALRLDELERQLGRSVQGVRLVKDRFSVQNATLDAMLGPQPNPQTAKSYAPVVFLQIVNLRGTTVQGDLSLPYTRFRLPVIATNLAVKGIATFTSSTFAANAVFDDVSLYDQGLFAEVEFSKVASFQRLDTTRRITFARATFNDDAWFHGAIDKPTRLRDPDFTQVRVNGPFTLDDALIEGPIVFTRSRLARGLNLERTTVQGPLLVDDATVSNGATFIRSHFRDRAIFARTTFVGPDAVSFHRSEFADRADFVDVTFKGPAIFVKTKFGRVRFTNVDFGEAADFRQAEFAVAGEFGAAAERTTFNKVAEFDSAKFTRASFQNALFRGRAKFVGTQFGDSSCPQATPIAVNFDGALFADTADFESATFLGKINLPRLVIEPGRLLLRWRDVGEQLASEPLMLRDTPACPGHREFVKDANIAAPKRDTVLRALERNFRSRDLLDDANGAYYEARHAEVHAAFVDAKRGRWERGIALSEMLFYGATSGYGVLAGRVVVLLLGCLVVFAGAYVVSGRLFVETTSPTAPVRWKVTELPGRSTKNPVRDARPFPRRLLAAILVSLAALVSVTVRDTRIELGLSDPWWWVLFAERMIGLAILVLLGITLTNSVPVLSKFLGWLL